MDWVFGSDTPRPLCGRCGRQQNLGILPGLPHCKQIRPMLDEPFAEHMWRELKARDATTWASWQEPFERAKGLLLEYAHILT